MSVIPARGCRVRRLLPSWGSEGTPAAPRPFTSFRAAAAAVPGLFGRNSASHASPQLLRVHHEQSLKDAQYVRYQYDLERRAFEHKEGKPGSSTARYKVNRLVYGEEFTDITQAIAREKEIKSMMRRQKIKLIESMNPERRDLSQE
jgi:putative endonuclease